MKRVLVMATRRIRSSSDGDIGWAPQRPGCLSPDSFTQWLGVLEIDPSPHPQQQEQQQRRGGGRVPEGMEESFEPTNLVRHESLPDLHLNARCLKGGSLGTIYCQGVRGALLPQARPATSS
ncbi:unnamed protein product, partial [Ectocarpus fasciculatus]